MNDNWRSNQTDLLELLKGFPFHDQKDARIRKGIKEQGWGFLVKYLIRMENYGL